MILDQYGQPIQEAGTSLDRISGGWIQTGGIGTSVTPTSLLALNVSREDVRTVSRAAYLLNPLLFGAVSVMHSFVLGEGLSYGDMPDKRAYSALEEFWAVNDLDQLANRWLTEYLVDGENLTLFPRDGEGQAAKASGPARIGFYDVSHSLELRTEDGVPTHITSVKLGEREYQEGAFVWSANEQLWNDPRGWPLVMRAITPALAYVNFVNSRIRVHEIQSRINGLYKAFTYSNDPGAELKAKASVYSAMPRNGAILTVHKDRQSGESEEFGFLETKANAADSKEDARLIRLLISAALQIPEHYLGEGGSVTRTTADSMGEPARRAFARLQNSFRGYLNRLYRLELKRRFGDAQRYTVRRVTVSEDGLTRKVETKKVSADVLEGPWLFPSLRNEDLEALEKKVRVANELTLASKQTLAGELGYDYALELERMAQELTPQGPQGGDDGGE